MTDPLPCPSCLTLMELTTYPDDEDGGWSMRCPACGYEVPGDDGDPPTLERWLAGEESGEWADVDLAAWSRMVARRCLEQLAIGGPDE